MFTFRSHESRARRRGPAPHALGLQEELRREFGRRSHQGNGTRLPAACVALRNGRLTIAVSKMGRLMRALLLAIFFLSLLSPAVAQSCDQICNDYKSFARRAGDPQTLAPLLKLYQACMQCAKGGGNMNCSPLASPSPNGIRCEYNAATQAPGH